jgi:hypothetical protein
LPPRRAPWRSWQRAAWRCGARGAGRRAARTRCAAPCGPGWAVAPALETPAQRSPPPTRARPPATCKRCPRAAKRGRRWRRPVTARHPRGAACCPPTAWTPHGSPRCWPCYARRRASRAARA